MGLPKGFKDGQKLFNDIRKSMNVNETNWSTEEILKICIFVVKYLILMKMFKPQMDLKVRLFVKVQTMLFLKQMVSLRNVDYRLN